jgi:4-hydroxy-L-threonine phosphate dehydrogenase PdxA
MGEEDDLVLAPAIDRCKAEGIDVTGPVPGDTVFLRASRGEFDAVIAAYHDQGLIPVKLLAFGTSVNVTLGLPIIRTSVDHGTAFDIAGQDRADASSMVEAVLLAARLARARHHAAAASS